MTDSALSSLTAASALSGTELFYGVQSSADRKVTAAQLATYVAGTAQPLDSLTATWTSSGTNYTGIGLNVTNSGSGTNSYLINLQIGGATIFGVRKDGAFQLNGTNFALQFPDSTATGGNPRGNNSADLQTVRSSATQVASGGASFAAGQNNTASGGQCGVVGLSNTVNGNYAFAAGGSNTVSGQWAAGFGNRVTVTGTSSIAHGAHASDRGTAYSHVHGFWNGPGTGGLWQSRRLPLTAITTSATPGPLCIENDTAGTTASSGNQIVLPNNSTFAFEALVTAHRTDTEGERAGYKVSGLIGRTANAASTAFVGSPTLTVLGESDATWDVAVSADTTLGALIFTATGAAGKTIRWAALVNMVEINA